MRISSLILWQIEIKFIIIRSKIHSHMLFISPTHFSDEKMRLDRFIMRKKAGKNRVIFKTA